VRDVNDEKRRAEKKGYDEKPEDVIATIHILKNKNQVKKRVVTRHVKNTE
jgi:hypothetical protein